MRHQDYIDEIEFIGEFDGTYWNVWLDKTFWGVLPGEYCDVLAIWVHPEYKERVQVLLSTKDDSGQVFEDISILPYSVRKRLINYLAEDIIEYIDWCEKRYEQDLDTEFDSWLDDHRIPRITVGFCVTEAGEPISGVLEFPKRHEDMDHGGEYEWYYSLREITDSIMKLKIGETIPFKIRDDRTSVGSVTRLK